MPRIIIPTHYVHTRIPLWTKETAPASIWQQHLDTGAEGAIPAWL